ncbi:MAG: CoA-binding protein [Candidatus Tectomicrobia bacterium]|nr:CoA-binding protein [Candidatus Tectomicrobia bacterium]
MDERLRALMFPRSIAVIGASANLATIGGRPLRLLRKHGFKGNLYPVNPKYAEIDGLRCYPSIGAVGEAIDCALIALGRDQVIPALEACAAAGVRAATVFSSGFAEVGGEGTRLQQEMTNLARRTGLRINGPNGMGVMNFKEGVVATFSNSAELERVRPGNLALVAQSGGLAGALLDRSHELGLGVSHVVSTGNEADVEASEYLEYLVEDPATEVVGAYIEGFRNVERLGRVCERAAQKRKPIIVLKAGSSTIGREMAASHTAAATGSDDIYNTFFRRHGIIRVADLDELMGTASLLTRYRHAAGTRLGVFSASGGAAVLIADECARHGIELPPLARETQQALAPLVGAFSTLMNPFDPTGQSYNDPSLVKTTFEIFLRDPNFDWILFLIPTVALRMADLFVDYLLDTAPQTSKPVLVYCIGGSLSSPVFTALRDSPLPYYRSLRTCFQALAAALRYQDFLGKRQHAKGLR